MRDALIAAVFFRPAPPDPLHPWRLGPGKRSRVALPCERRGWHCGAREGWHRRQRGGVPLPAAGASHPAGAAARGAGLCALFAFRHGSWGGGAVGKGLSCSPGSAGRCVRKNKVKIIFSNNNNSASHSRGRERAARRLRWAGGGGRSGPGRAGRGGGVGGGGVRSRAVPCRADPSRGWVMSGFEEEPPPPALLLSGAGTWPQAAAAAGRPPPPFAPSAMGTPHF